MRAAVPALLATTVAIVLAAACTPSRPPDSTSELLAARASYPAHWWAPVSRAGAPDWEILPQEAKPGEVIVSKRHELGLLSNFAATPFIFHGNRYASVEGLWQMMLYPEDENDPRAKFPGLAWLHTRDQVAAMTGFEAKESGTLAEQYMARMGIGWVTFEGNRFDYRPEHPGTHYKLIVEAMREKVNQNPEVRRVLLATCDLILKPDHHEEPVAKAAWRYCDILMQIRDELRRKDAAGAAPQGGSACARSRCRPHPHFHLVLCVVIDERHGHAGLVVAVEGEPLVSARVRRLMHDDVVDGLAVAVVHGEAGPIRGQARLDPQPLTLESHTKQRLDDESVHPGG
jgi:predicted NAD-dependent protein-ADP-ribosyltransferase YbiA (DUF1768 family)